VKVTLACTHFALADAALGIGDRMACEVCGTHRTIVHTGSGINITVNVARDGGVTITEARKTTDP
jgi:hypothetical protein